MWSRIPRHVNLFVSGCVCGLEGGRRKGSVCESAAPLIRGWEKNCMTTVQPPVNPRFNATPPYRHITGKPLTITGCSRYYFSWRECEQLFKCSWVFDLRFQVHTVNQVLLRQPDAPLRSHPLVVGEWHKVHLWLSVPDSGLWPLLMYADDNPDRTLTQNSTGAHIRRSVSSIIGCESLWVGFD